FSAFRLAFAIAPGTPGIGKVTTGLPSSIATFVFSPPAAAALDAPCGLLHRRISRSLRAARLGDGVPRPGTSPAPTMSSSHANAPLTTSIALLDWLFGRSHIYLTHILETWY